MSEYSKIPISPTQISVDLANGKLIPSGPKLIRKLSDLKGCFKNEDAWKKVNPKIAAKIESLEERLQNLEEKV